MAGCVYDSRAGTIFTLLDQRVGNCDTRQRVKTFSHLKRSSLRREDLFNITNQNSKVKDSEIYDAAMV